jgi:hypothetical protein
MYTAGSSGLPVTTVSSLSGLSYNEPIVKGKEKETDDDCDMTGKREEESSKDQRHNSMKVTYFMNILSQPFSQR